jgi:hypothetical protein
MNKNIIVFIIYTFIWVVLLGGTKVWTSGFHFVDDHEVYDIHEYITQHGLPQALMKWIKDDFNIRFRPFYYFQRVMEVYLFKDNFLWYYLLNTLVAILSSFFFYLFAVNIKFNRIFAIIFPLFVLLGTQAEIWSRLGPAETQGIFYLSIALWMCSCAVYSKNRLSYEFVAIFFMMLSSLCKESFVIFIPCFAMTYFWLIKGYGQIPIKDILLKHLPFFVTLLLICLMEVFVIIWYVGTNTVGYAGVDGVSGVYIKNIFVSLKELLFFGNNNNNLGFYFIILLGTIGYTQKYRVKKSLEKVESVSSEIWIIFLITVTGLFPQLILYMKSGMENRYLLPSTLALSLLMIYLANLLVRLDSNKTIHLLLTCFFCVTLINTSINCYRSYKNFTSDGISTNNFLSAIKNNTASSDSILFISDPIADYEWSWSNKIYFRSRLNYRKNTRFYFFLDKQLNEYDSWMQDQLRSVKSEFRNELFEKKDSLNYKAIALPVSMDAHLQAAGIPINKYVRQTFGNRWILYYSK